MHIANPIYDVVFKYMLEDNKVAKLFLSAIIGEEILELDYIQNEVTREKIPLSEVEENSSPPQLINISRFDFAAKIRAESGFKTVTIELQRAKFLADLMRFRRYLGLHYQREENSYKDDKDNTHPRQIYCIFFLGYDTNLPARPVLKVDYSVKDACSGEELHTTDEFVSGLHHVSWIIQINLLKESRRNQLEQVLSVFDQTNIIENRQLLDINDETYPEAYRVIIRRLRKAMEDYEIRRKMELEDDVLNAFQKQAKEMEKLNKVVAQQGQTIADKDQTIADNAQTIADKDQTIADKDQTIADKDQTISTLSNQNESLSNELNELKKKFGLN